MVKFTVVGGDASSDLAKRIISLTNSKSEIKFIPFEDTNRQRNREIIKRIPDISKAKNHLEYNPQISLNEGIKTISNEK